MTTTPSIAQIFEAINAGLSVDPSKVPNLQAVYQFNITGDDPGTYQLIIAENSGKAVQGAPEQANCTLEMDAEVFKGMMAGTVNSTASFMNGQLKIDGDLGLALQLQTILDAYTS
jgi:putative sterol carrier protein